MKDWYDNLEAREQVFVLIGVIFVSVALIYYVLWAPLDRNHRQVATRVATWERSLAELRPLQALVASGGLNTSAGAKLQLSRHRSSSFRRRCRAGDWSSSAVAANQRPATASALSSKKWRLTI